MGTCMSRDESEGNHGMKEEENILKIRESLEQKQEERNVCLGVKETEK